MSILGEVGGCNTEMLRTWAWGRMRATTRVAVAILLGLSEPTTTVFVDGMNWVSLVLDGRWTHPARICLLNAGGIGLCPRNPPILRPLGLTCSTIDVAHIRR